MKRSGPDGTIVYIDDLYEKRSTASGTKHGFHVEGTDGKIGQVVYDEATGAEVVEYQVHDALGSTGVVFGQNGAVIERMFNEPFGGRINADGSSFVAAPKNTLDGFTGHEMEHGLGLINMRGRMFGAPGKAGGRKQVSKERMVVCIWSEQVLPWEGAPPPGSRVLRRQGRPCRRSVDRRVGWPGDGASKTT